MANPLVIARREASWQSSLGFARPLVIARRSRGNPLRFVEPEQRPLACVSKQKTTKFQWLIDEPLIFLPKMLNSRHPQIALLSVFQWLTREPLKFSTNFV